MNTLEFIYQEKQLHFLLNPKDKNVMINATQMAKLFNKRIDFFLKAEHTKKFIKCLESRIELLPPNGGNKIIYSNKRGGTFMTEILALKFAAWLDPEFEIWVYQTIREILTKETKLIKVSVNEIKCAEIELNEAIENAKRADSKEALALIEAYNKCETAKKKKGKAMRKFNKQIALNI